LVHYPLIELPVARAAPKAPVPQFGPFSSFNRVSCFTMWTPHPPIPPRCDSLHSAAASYKLGQFLTEPLTAPRCGASNRTASRTPRQNRAHQAHTGTIVSVYGCG